MRTRAIVLPLLAAVALAATALTSCGSGDDEPAATSGTGGSGAAGAAVTAADLDGRGFVSTAISGRELVPGTQVALTFEDGTLGAQAGCNTMGGSFRLDDGVLGWNAAPATTMIGCRPELLRQDDWLAAFLSGGVKLTAPAAGELVLRGDGIELTLREGTAAGSSQPPPIVGTTWTLATIADAGPDGSASSVPAGVRAPTLRFTADDRAELFSGCNSGGGRGVVRTDGFAEIGPLTLTRMACDEAAMAIERAVTAILDGRVALGIDGGGNLVVSKAGRQLVFRAG